MEILTLENERKWGSNTITAHMPDGSSNFHDNAYREVNQIVNKYLNMGFTAPQAEIGKFIANVTKQMRADITPVLKHSLTLMRK